MHYVVRIAQLQRHPNFYGVVVDDSGTDGSATIRTKENEAVFKSIRLLEKLPERMNFETQSAGTRVLDSGLIFAGVFFAEFAHSWIP